MNEAPPPVSVQAKADAEHLKLLAIFHLVVAGLSLLGVAVVFLQWTFMQAFFTSPEMTKNLKGGPPPEIFLIVWKWMLVFMGAYSVAKCAGNVVSAWCIHHRRARLFSLIMAGANCISVPFGTALGVCTFIVLLRPSVAGVYGAKERGMQTTG